MEAKDGDHIKNYAQIWKGFIKDTQLDAWLWMEYEIKVIKAKKLGIDPPPRDNLREVSPRPGLQHFCHILKHVMFMKFFKSK